MTTNQADRNMTIEEIESAADQAREFLAQIKRSRDEQPDRLAKAREDADEARGWAILEEPWDSQWSAIPGHSVVGEITAMLAVPNITAKELFGSRLAFDILDCGDDDDRINEVLGRYFSMVQGDTGMAFLLMSSALSTIASLVVPQMLDEIEQHGSNYDTRVMLAEARAKAWRGRVSELRGPQDKAADSGVKPIDGYDIGAQAFDAEDEQ
ncbi:hypothetical protein BH09ACT7_BH09ACT7_08410 [soil metagenome]